MAKEIKRINISPLPDLLHLTEEVRRDNRVVVLTNNGEDVARLSPLAPNRSGRRGHREADLAAFLAAAGSWKDVDTDRLVEDIYESRARSSRPPVDL
jgi:antitoxin (DNA-binding transcriptional repressor) of toxin-antitoxin stability system